MRTTTRTRTTGTTTTPTSRSPRPHLQMTWAVRQTSRGAGTLVARWVTDESRTHRGLAAA